MHGHESRVHFLYNFVNCLCVAVCMIHGWVQTWCLFALLFWGDSFVSACLQRILFFYLTPWTYHFYHESSLPIWVELFGGSLFLPFSLSTLASEPYALEFHFIYGSSSPPTFFSFKSALAIFGFLHFHVKFRNILSNSLKNIVIFMEMF